LLLSSLLGYLLFSGHGLKFSLHDIELEGLVFLQILVGVELDTYCFKVLGLSRSFEFDLHGHHLANRSYKIRDFCNFQSKIYIDE